MVIIGHQFVKSNFGANKENEATDNADHSQTVWDFTGVPHENVDLRR